MIKDKKGMGALAWILIILIILAVCGIVAWFLFSGNGSSVIDGSSIPQPPTLPAG